MARAPIDQPLLPSVLDRLIGGSGTATQTQRRRINNLVQLRNAIRRDLEDLLNSRQRAQAVPGDLGVLDRSIFDYGIPDLSDVSLTSKSQIDGFRAHLESTILQFDPRFRRVTVKVERADATEHTLRFRIEAVVHVHPFEEEVTLHSYMDPTTREFSVGGRDT